MNNSDKHYHGFVLDSDTGYFRNDGVDVMAFDDIYPVGHQSGVSIIMHGTRIATNGDIRFEQTPGQWQPVPKQKERTLNKEQNTITTKLGYPDYDAHLKGFNPMIYPDFEFDYEVSVKGKMGIRKWGRGVRGPGNAGIQPRPSPPWPPCRRR